MAQIVDHMGQEVLVTQDLQSKQFRPFDAKSTIPK